MLEEQAPSEEQTSEVAEKRTRKRGWLAPLIASVALVAVVATFGAFALARSGLPGGGNPTTGLSPAQDATTATWRVYHDPLGLFTIRVPPGWKAAGGVDGSYTDGNTKTGLSDSGQTEFITISDPTQGNGSALFQLSAYQIDSDSGRQLTCQNFPNDRTNPTSINGYPADAFQPGVVWMVNSQTAHFQIDITIPGVVVPFNPGGPMIPNPPPPTPTALPQSWVQQDRTLLADALGSFKPTAKPLTCS
jgi:hypothetical protein